LLSWYSIPDFLNSHAVLHCVDVKSARASSWSDSMTKENISQPYLLSTSFRSWGGEGGEEGQGEGTPVTAALLTMTAMTTKRYGAHVGGSKTLKK
jgi:hypothetical protein